MKQSNINYKPKSQKYKNIPMKILSIIIIIIIIYHQPLNDLSKVTARKETRCDDFHILERISSTIWTNRKALHPTHINFVGALLLTYRPNNLNFGLGQRGQRNIFSGCQRRIIFFGNPCTYVEKWNLGSCLGLVTVKGRHLSHCMFIGRFCAANAFDGFFNITTHFLLTFYKLKSGDAVDEN